MSVNFIEELLENYSFHSKKLVSMNSLNLFMKISFGISF